MAKKKSASKVPVVDQFKELFRQVIHETRRLGKKSTAEIPVYQEAVDYVKRHEIPGANQLLSAMLLCRQGQAEEALKVVEDGDNEKLPQSLLGQMYYVKGYALGNLGRDDEAIEFYQKALDAPGYDTPGVALNSMGIAFGAKDEHDHAIECYQKALDTPGYDTPGLALNNMGLAYAAKGEHDRAIECYQKALDTPGYDSPGLALYNMGIDYADKGELDLAIESYQKALGTPDYDGSGDSLHNLAVAYSRKGQNELAIECYQKALNAPRYDTPQLTRINLANALRRVGKFDDADAQIEQVLAEPDLEGEHQRATYIQGLIKESRAGVRPSADDEALTTSPGTEKSDTPEERMRSKLQGTETEQRDKYRIYLERKRSDRDNVFSCLRGWSSSVTLLEGATDSHWRGGGYFLKWRGKGLVIDPGFDFIDNFHDAGYNGGEIDAVLVSHNHSDHNYDLRSLDDLRYELHRRWVTDPPPNLTLSNYLVVLDEDTLKGFDPKQSDFRISETFAIKKSVRKKWLKPANGLAVTIEHFPVEHGDDVPHAVGMRLNLHSDSGQPDFVLGYTADTEYFEALPEHLQNCDVLLAHISMPDPAELNLDVAGQKHEKKKHLGLNGVAKLIKATSPKLTLIGEFWAGLADIRIELVQALRRRTGNNNILPTGLGFHLHFPSLQVECTNCRKRIPHDSIKIAPAATAFGPLGYLCGSCIA